MVARSSLVTAALSPQLIASSLPLPGLGTLELPREVFDKHLLRSQSSPVKDEQPASELLDADQLEKRTGIPVSPKLKRA